MKKIGKEMGEQCISKVVVGMVLRMIQNVPEQGGLTYKRSKLLNPAADAAGLRG